MTAAIIPFPRHFKRDLLSDPEVATAIDLIEAAESDDEHESALWGVTQALRTQAATADERRPIWRRLAEPS